MEDITAKLWLVLTEGQEMRVALSSMVLVVFLVPC